MSHTNPIRRVYTCRFQFCPKRLDKVSRGPLESMIEAEYTLCVHVFVEGDFDLIFSFCN